jgi:hypothetical protein
MYAQFQERNLKNIHLSTVLAMYLLLIQKFGTTKFTQICFLLQHTCLLSSQPLTLSSGWHTIHRSPSSCQIFIDTRTCSTPLPSSPTTLSLSSLHRIHFLLAFHFYSSNTWIPSFLISPFTQHIPHMQTQNHPILLREEVQRPAPPILHFVEPRGFVVAAIAVLLTSGGKDEQTHISSHQTNVHVQNRNHWQNF